MTEGHEPTTPAPPQNAGLTTASPSNPAPIPASAHSEEAPKSTSPRSPRDYIVTGAIALVFSMIGSYVFTHFLDSRPEAHAELQQTEPEAGVLSNRDLTEQLSKLSDRIQAVDQRVAAIPKPEPAPDLSDLQVQVANVTHASEGIPPLREAFKRMETRIEEMNRSVTALSDEVHGSRYRNGSASDSGNPKPASSSAAPPPLPGERNDSLDIKSVPERLVPAEMLEPAVRLFRQQKYKEALDLFTRLEQSSPEDARVWYYAALAHGFVHNQWNDEGTLRLVQKAIACERAGLPPKPIIDETFAHLTPMTGKDWLATYRKSVVVPQ